MVKVFSEYNIRKVIGLGVTNITYQDGSESTGGTILPCAAVSLVKEADNVYTLYGGGYGHGLGMSQNGANGLAKTGMSYQDILHFFYKRCLDYQSDRKKVNLRIRMMNKSQ